MQEARDTELLRQYVRQNSEEAFAALVTRYVNMVYSAALRKTGNPAAAEEITQAVFIILAKKADELSRHDALTGWLYQTTRLTAGNFLRAEIRRARREQEAYMQSLSNQTESDSSRQSGAAAEIWPQIISLLEDAMGRLGEKDRNALALRFFEGKSFQEIGAAFGASENAAKKRVAYALEKLRVYFSKHGVSSTTAIIAGAISANSVQAAPAGLAAIISATALSGTTITTAAVLAITKAIAMTTLQKALVTTALVATVGAGVFEAHQNLQLREQNQTLQQQQVSLADQIQQLNQSLADATNRQTYLMAENGQLKSKSNEGELLKLRGEVGQLQQELKDLPAARVALLKQKLEEMPDKKIPELKFLTEKDWLNAAWNADLETDDGVRIALSKLRDEAVDTFLGLTRTALKKYLAANNNMLPADLLPLKPYFDTPVTDDMLQRYAFMQTGQLSSNPSDSVVRKAVYADEDYDSNQEMSMTGGGGGSFNRIHDAIYDAVVTFTIDNNGQLPSDTSQITSYLKKSIDTATIQKYFGQITTDIAANPPSPEKIAIAPAVKAYTAAHNGQHPKNPSDLLPYIITPEQKAAVQKSEQEYEQHNSVPK